MLTHTARKLAAQDSRELDVPERFRCCAEKKSCG
jgi:hypothetical protein